MKPVMEWLKKNWLIVVCVVVIVASIPLAVMFSLGWNKKILATRTQEVDTLWKKVTGQDVPYHAPVPGGKAIDFKGPPNAKTTERVKAIKTAAEAEGAAVVKRAEDFNKGVGADAQLLGRVEHRPLIDGFLPGPGVPDVIKEIGEEAFKALAEDRKRPTLEQRYLDMIEPKRREMEDALLAKGGRADVYAELLKRMNAVAPPRAGEVLQMLEQVRQTERDKVAVGREPTAEEAAAIGRTLADNRLGIYQKRAGEGSLYAARTNLGVAKTSRPVPSEDLFKSQPALLTIPEFYTFQWDLWVMEDMATAIRNVNTVDGKPTPIERSTVKRIERLDIQEMGRLQAATAHGDEGPGMPGSTPAAPATPAAAGSVPLDMSVSLTGRTSAPANEVYDVRNVELVAIVSSERLQSLVDAISRTNFNTVIGGTIERVDVPADLERGFFYGNEHVVKVTMQIETVWLRSWMQGYMPLPVRQALGVKAAGDEQMPAAGAAGATPSGGSAAPPPPPSGRRPGGVR